MKNTFLIVFIIILSSCQEEQENTFDPCFEASTEHAKIGEEIQFTDCSQGAVTYQYDFGEFDDSSSEPNPKYAYTFGGERTVRLTIEDESGAKKATGKNIIVDAFESDIILLEFLNQWDAYPFGFDKRNENYYYTQRLSDNNGTFARYINIVELDASFDKQNSVLVPIDDFPAYSYTHILSNGNIQFNFINYRFSGITEIVVDADFNIVSNTQSDNSWFGVLSSGSNTAYYGTTRPQGNTVPTIELQDASGQTLKQLTYDEVPSGVIGDMIQTGDNYLAFGASVIEGSNNEADKYEPFTLLLNAAFEFISTKKYTSTTLSSSSDSQTKLVNKYRIASLDDGNFVLHSRSEVRIISGDLEELASFEVNLDRNGVIPVSGGFILGSNVITLYSNDGTELKSISSRSSGATEFIKDEGTIYFFTSGSDCSINTEDCVSSTDRPFIGAISEELTMIGLN